MVQIGIINSTMEYSDEDIAKGMQNFLICIEMFLAAIAHRWVFEYQDFVGEIDDTVLTSESAVAAAGKSASIASSIPSNGRSRKSGLTFWKNSGYEKVCDLDESSETSGSDDDESGAQHDNSTVSKENASFSEDTEAKPGDLTRSQSGRKPFFRALIESSFPGDVVSDIGRHVSRRHREEIKREARVQWGPASHFSGRNVRIEPRGYNDISAVANVTSSSAVSEEVDTGRQERSARRQDTESLFTEHREQPDGSIQYIDM